MKIELQADENTLAVSIRKPAQEFAGIQFLACPLKIQ